jgi:hypothetical protein
MSARALPAAYRQASNIRTGYDLKKADGTWVEVTFSLHVMSPMNFVTMNLADGTTANFPPRTRLMSRRRAEVSS